MDDARPKRGRSLRMRRPQNPLATGAARRVLLAALLSAGLCGAAAGAQVVFHVPFEGAAAGYDGRHDYPDLFVNKEGKAAALAYEAGVLGRGVVLTWDNGYPGLSYAAGHVFRPEGGTLSVWLRQDQPFFINRYYPRIWAVEGPLVEGLFGPADAVRGALPPLAQNDDALAAVREDGKWHHHVVVWDRAAGRRVQYLDGKPVGEGPYRPNPPADFPGAVPGRWPMRIGYRWVGAMDELLVLDGPLDASAVQTLFETYARGESPYAALRPAGASLYPEAEVVGDGVARPAGLKTAAPELGAPLDDTSLRKRYALDGVWRFRLADDDAAAAAADDVLDLLTAPAQPAAASPWYAADVPGVWGGDPARPPAVRDAAGRTVRVADLTKGKRVCGAWFERDVRIPADAEGKAVILALPWLDAASGPVNTRDFGDVYVNGRHAGAVALPGGETLVITDHVRFGADNRIAIRTGRPYGGLAAAGDRAVLPAGLTRAPLLEFRQARLFLSEPPLVTPLVRRQTLRLAVPLRSLAATAQTLGCTAVLTDTRTGEVLRRAASSPIPLPAGFRGDAAVEISAAGLAHWSPDDPHLYTLELELGEAGRVSDKTPPVRFGYRQLWTENGDFFLNGKRLLVRGASHNYLYNYGFTSREIALRKQVGQNSDRTWSPDRAHLPTLDVCDEEGWLVWFTGDPVTAADLCREVWNHPSVVAWSLGGDGALTGPHGHPLSLGEPVAGDAADPGVRLAARVRAADPGRVCGWYRSGAGGDFRSIMHYMGWGTPLQHIEEWLTDWSARRHEPFMPLELSLMMTPQEYTVWQRNRLHSVLTEHAARYLGDEAYALSDDRLIALTAPTLPPDTPNAGNALVAMHHPLHTRIRGWIYERALRAWRVSRASGWLLHQDGKLQYTHDGAATNAFGAVFVRNNADVLFYIGGATNDLLAKDHAFWSGETVEKTLIVCNDGLGGPLQGTLTWSFDGAGLAPGGKPVVVEQGAMLAEPLRFVVPEVATKTTLVLRGEFRSGDGKVVQRDTFALQAHPRREPVAWTGTKVALIDSTGETGSALRHLGVPYTLFNQEVIDGGRTLTGYGLVVIGRNSYPEAAALMRDGFLQLEGAVEAGANLVVLAQRCRAVLGLRVENFNSRHVFPRDAASPLLQGLDAADLCDWRGASGDLPPYGRWDEASGWREGKASKHGQWNRFGQLRNWHWSNKGMVATFCFAKPQFGNFRVLLDNGFDALYTPLLEFRRGRGRIVLSQLELAPNVAREPAAALLLERILRHYGRNVETAALQPVGCLGEDADRIALRRLRVDANPGLEGAVVFLAGEQFAGLSGDRSAAVEAFVKKGGTLLTRLPAGAAAPAWLGGSGKAETAPVGKLDVPADPLFAGLGPADFFWRWGTSADLIDGALVAIRPHGEGRVLLVQVPPAHFAGSEETRWQQDKLLRIYATLLTNLGVRSAVKPDLGAIAGSGEVADWLLGDRPEPPPAEDFCGDGKLYEAPPLDFDPEEHHVW